MPFISKKRRFQRGQTLILAMLAIIVIAAAMVFLFDLQNIIRGKIKAQTAADSAALIGAKWQANTLNVIGELNIIKACTVLITDMPETASGGYSTGPLWEPNASIGSDGELYGDLACLKECATLISQMQVRASFVGPLIGFGAAQQAAKNNGLSYIDAYNEDLYMKYNYLSSSEGDLFYGEDVVKPAIFDYYWREPYAEMVRNLLQSSGSSQGTGVAVTMNSEWVSDPELESDSDIFNNYLTNEAIYDAINANYWCALTGLLRENFSSSKWWGNIELLVAENDFSYESELLPVNVKHKSSSGWSAYNRAANTSGAFEGADSSDDRIMDNYNAPSGYDRPSMSKLLHKKYDTEDPVLCTAGGEYLYDSDGKTIPYDAGKYDIEQNGEVNRLYYVDPDTGNRVYPGLYTKDTDECWNPFPKIYWTIYDTSAWYAYEAEDSDNWTDTWGTFLKGGFKEGYRYYGAVSIAGSLIEPTLISSRWNRLKLDSDASGEDDEYIGDALKVGRETSAAGSDLNTYARRLKSAETAMNNHSVKDIEVISLAKPYGRIPVADGKYLIPCAVSMVLPVFDRPQLIPVDLERPSNYTPNFKWSAFKREYLPLLGTVDNIDSMPALMAATYPEHWNAGWFTDYHNALVKLNNADWRQQGIDWLETVIDKDTDTTNEDTCDDWTGTGPGPRYAPSTPF